VTLLGVPLGAGRAVATFCNDMIRELQLIELGQGLEDVAPSGLDPVAKALRTDLTWLRDDFGGHLVSSDPDAVRDPSADPDQVVDFTGDLLPEAAILIQRVVDQFEELNWFSSHGQLLTVGASPIVMDTVRWLRREVVGQLIDGRAATPFPARVG
jgi:hypothetical protein